MIRRHGPAVTSNPGGRRQDRGSMGREQRSRRGAHEECGGGTDEPSVEWTDGKGGWGTSLVAAITVSGRHALLVGYQPDEALRPSLASSRPPPRPPLSRSLSLPAAHPAYFFLSPSFEISSSPCRVASRAAGGTEFIDGTLYLYARLSALTRADGLPEKSRANASGAANCSLSRGTDPHFV